MPGASLGFPQGQKEEDPCPQIPVAVPEHPRGLWMGLRELWECTFPQLLLVNKKGDKETGKTLGLFLCHKTHGAKGDFQLILL